MPPELLQLRCSWVLWCGSSGGSWVHLSTSYASCQSLAFLSSGSSFIALGLFRSKMWSGCDVCFRSLGITNGIATPDRVTQEHESFSVHRPVSTHHRAVRTAVATCRKVYRRWDRTFASTRRGAAGPRPSIPMIFGVSVSPRAVIGFICRMHTFVPRASCVRIQLGHTLPAHDLRANAHE